MRLLVSRIWRLIWSQTQSKVLSLKRKYVTGEEIGMSLVMPSSPHIFPTMLKVRKTPHKTKMWIICLIYQFVGIFPKILFFVCFCYLVWHFSLNRLIQFLGRVSLRKTRFPVDWRLLSKELISNIGIPLDVLQFALLLGLPNNSLLTWNSSWREHRNLLQLILPLMQNFVKLGCSWP